MDKKAALSYLLRIGRTTNEHMIRLTKDIWHYLPNHNMAIKAEYLPSVLTTVVDRESRKKKTDSSEWLTHPKIFQEVYRLLDSLNTSICFPPMETTTSMYSPDPYSQGTDAMIQNWNIGLHFAFPPFSMISRVLLKIKQEFVSLLILIALVWSTQPCYSKLLNPCVREAVPMSQGQ